MSVSKNRAMIVGAVAAVVATLIQHYTRPRPAWVEQGTSQLIIQLIAVAMAGALIGLGVAAFLNRKRN